MFKCETQRRGKIICLCFTVTLKQYNYIFCLTTAVQVVDEADATEPEPTEPHSTLDREEAGDLRTEKTEELHDTQSPRSPDDQGPEKVMLLKGFVNKLFAVYSITYPGLGFRLHGIKI